METARFPVILATIFEDFVRAGLIRLGDKHHKTFQKISENCTVDLFCIKCKYASQINFFTYDDHISAHCETCHHDYINLDTELKQLLFYNVMQEKRLIKKELC